MNQACKEVLDAWENADHPCDLADLVVLLNNAAASAVKMVDELDRRK